MPKVLKISEAASLALHTMVFLAAHAKKNHSAKEMASALGVSEAHLAKVMQRLSHAGLVKSQRGPRGGFVLGKDARDITLLEVYEVTEGPFEPNTCLLGNPICSGSCILGGLVAEVDHRVKEYLTRTNLAQLTPVFSKEGCHA
jgi:Rrf2 family protein